MKLTKYAQSCFLIKTETVKLLIDPGFIKMEENIILEWMNPDFILVTHKHQDHYSEADVEKIISIKTKIYASKETAAEYPKCKFEVIKENDILQLGDLTVEVVKSLHGYNPLLKGGKEVNEGLGLIISDGKTKIYHTGDTICFENDYKCDVILLPFNNHGVAMGPFEAALFAKETGAKLVIPMHYDNPKYPGDIEKLKEELRKNDLKYRFLNIGESIEL
jgi:L-ascorbate metabolism protein UlaG (beta-lactamase superfamily)